MSIEALDWAFKLRMQDPVAKGVLLALCNHYNPKHGGCWPSVDRIAREAGTTRRPVQRALRRLERWQLIICGLAEKRGNTFYEMLFTGWLPSQLIEADLPDDELALFGLNIVRRRYSGVDKLKEQIEGGVSETRGGVVEVTHPWRTDALIIIEPEVNSFADRSALASEVNDWELAQLGWERPAHVKPSCVQGG